MLEKQMIGDFKEKKRRIIEHIKKMNSLIVDLEDEKGEPVKIIRDLLVVFDREFHEYSYLLTTKKRHLDK